MMANTFYLEPIDGGDQGKWGPKELRINSLNSGVLTCKLYNDSGTLKLSVGKIGLNDGSTGIVIVDTVTTISLASVSASNWFKVEVTRTGSTPNFTATNITGETNPASFPAAVDGYFDGSKGGYYRVGTSRLLGVGYLDSGNALNGIVMMCSNYEGYRGFVYNDAVAHNITYYYNRDLGANLGIVEKGTLTNGVYTIDNTGLIKQWMKFTKSAVAQSTAFLGGFRTDLFNETLIKSLTTPLNIQISANSNNVRLQFVAMQSNLTTTQTGTYALVAGASSASIDLIVYIYVEGV